MKLHTWISSKISLVAYSDVTYTLHMLKWHSLYSFVINSLCHFTYSIVTLCLHAPHEVNLKFYVAKTYI